MSSDVDARHRAKLASRDAGTATVVVMHNPEPSRSPQGSEVDARYQRKMAARAAPVIVEQSAKPASEDAELERMLAEEAAAKPASEAKPKR